MRHTQRHDEQTWVGVSGIDTALWTGAGASGAATATWLIWRAIRWAMTLMSNTAESGEAMYERRVSQLAQDFDAYRVTSQEQIDKLLTRLDNAHRRVDATVARLDLAEAQLTLCRQESAETHLDLVETRAALGRVQGELALLRGG